MTTEGVKTLVSRLCGSYSIRQGPGMLEAWAEAMHGIEDSYALSALMRHVKDSDKPPKPSEILRSVAGVRAPRMQGPTEVMERLNRKASLDGRDRMARGDEVEQRFQRFMLRKAALEGWLNGEHEAYFNRVLGREEVQMALEAAKP